MNRRVRVGAYFYPNEPSCLVRMSRAGNKKVESEPVLARQVKPLFPGHDQPRKYCLGSRNWVDWDDSNIKTVKRHVDLAQEACLDFFIIDTYMGIRNGAKIHESAGFLSGLSSLSSSRMRNLYFGMMYCLKAPRTIMAIRPGNLETNREFDSSLDTARFIVDCSARKYWWHTNYLMVDNRPYISFFLPGTGVTGERFDDFKAFFNEIRQYSLNKYKIEPYIVGVVSHRSPVADALVLEKIGVDAISGYSNILNFPQVEPVVKHVSLIDARLKEWKKISSLIKIPVEPTVQVGLDTTPRCQYVDPKGIAFQPTSIKQLRPFVGQYPHSLIVTGSTSETFETMLKKLVQLVRNLSIPDSEKIITVNAWNEMTEGSCMLPRVREKHVDTSFINTCRKVLLH